MSVGCGVYAGPAGERERERGKRGSCVRLTVHEPDLVERLACPVAVSVHHLGELGRPFHALHVCQPSIVVKGRKEERGLTA